MEEMKRKPRPANLRTGRTPITVTESVEEKTKKFLNLHIGEISFNAGDANSKLNINLRDGLDVEYNATTTEEKKSSEEELANKIGAVFETLKNITPPPATLTPEPTENGKEVVKEPPVIPASTNNTNNPNNPTEKPITRKEYKMLVNSMYGMQDTILELNKTLENCIRSIEILISENK